MISTQHLKTENATYQYSVKFCTNSQNWAIEIFIERIFPRLKFVSGIAKCNIHKCYPLTKNGNKICDGNTVRHLQNKNYISPDFDNFS